MNSYLTYCARAKILDIIEREDCNGVIAQINSNSLFSIELIEDSNKAVLSFLPNANLIKISSAPIILIDYLSLQKLVNRVVDFDYKTQEFVIGES